MAASSLGLVNYGRAGGTMDGRKYAGRIKQGGSTVGKQKHGVCLCYQKCKAGASASLASPCLASPGIVEYIGGVNLTVRRDMFWNCFTHPINCSNVDGFEAQREPGKRVGR